MPLTKEDVLQKVNDYCTEKQYTSATLTDAFKDKFVTHFMKANPEASIDDESLIANMKFALNTAFSSASDIATLKQTEFTTKESEYQRQIEELKKTQKTPPATPPNLELPKEVKDQLEELKRFKDEKTQQEKLANIIKIAKKGIREDLHASFDSFASDYEVDDTEDEKQAEYLTKRYKEIFKSTVGDITPQKPSITAKDEEEFFKSLKKVKVQ